MSGVQAAAVSGRENRKPWTTSQSSARSRSSCSSASTPSATVRTPSPRARVVTARTTALSNAPRANARDERAIDLEGVDREALQEPERGVTRPEVVDRDAHAEPAQLAEKPGGRAHVLHDRGLGHLHLQRRSADGVVAQQAVDEPGKRTAFELTRRDVDAHPHRWNPRLGPAADLGDRALEHPRSDRVDRAGLLGDGDEAIRHHLAVFGMIPADQRLDAGDPPRRDVVHRLIVQLELPRSIAPRRSRRVSARSKVEEAFPALYQRTVLRPRRLASNTAASAAPISAGTSPASSGASATPIDGVRSIGLPATRNGSRNAPTAAFAAPRAPPGDSSVQSTTNSSPPKRGDDRDVRRALCDRDERAGDRFRAARVERELGGKRCRPAVILRRVAGDQHQAHVLPCAHRAAVLHGICLLGYQPR
jgi:hypothetical protein